MYETALYPPNSQRLSENVIGKVEVRHLKKRRLNEGPHATEPSGSEPNHRISGELKPTEQFSIVAQTQKDASPPGDKDTSGQSSAERALARHRLVRRNTQRRYRKKLQNKGIDLETSVTQLRAEIQRLQQMKSEPQHILIAMTPWKAIVEQSRLFRYGFRPPVPVSELCSDKTPQCSDLAYVQTRFTQTIMAPDVHNNAGYGVKAGLENWRLISLHHENLVIELVRLERGPGESVVAYQNATTTFTANMLRQALPHLVDDERGWDPVAVKLIGQKLVVPGTLRFDWDPSTNKVVRTHYEIDMLTSLLALLGSVEDVSSVLDSALAIDYWSTTTCR